MILIKLRFYIIGSGKKTQNNLICFVFIDILEYKTLLFLLQINRIFNNKIKTGFLLKNRFLAKYILFKHLSRKTNTGQSVSIP